MQLLLLILISYRCTYQVTYQLCHQISVNFSPLTAYWFSLVANKSFSYKTGLRSLRHHLLYSLSRINIFSVVNKALGITEGIIFPLLTFQDFRGLVFVYFQQLIQNKPIMFYRVLLVIFYRKEAFNGQNIGGGLRTWSCNN